MTTVPLKAKLVGIALLGILIFALIGTALEQVKDLQDANTALARPMLITEQFAAAGGELSPDSDGVMLASLKYA